MDKNKAVAQYILDYCQGNAKKFSAESKKEQNDAIKKMLIEANGGSNKLTLKTFKRGTAIFDIIEEVIIKSTIEGLQEDDFFTQFVEQRNLAAGDTNEFVIIDECDYVVSNVARGIKSIRRQRANSGSTIQVNPTTHQIMIYEELCRILSGRTDIADMIAACTKSMKRAMLEDVYTAWAGVTSTTLGAKFVPTAGAYSEDALLDVVQAVEAANNSKCIIITTLKGARKIKASDGSEIGKQNVYDYGYSLMWNGVPVQVMPQHFKAGTTDYVFDDNKVFVIPVTMDKPIKQVISGDDMLEVGTGHETSDRTVEVSLTSYWGTVVCIGDKYGIYTMA